MYPQRPKQMNEKYCVACGFVLQETATFCSQCGAKQTYYGEELERELYEEKAIQESSDWLTTLLLCFFLGALGIHRFYTKSTVIGVIQLLTLGGCGVWVFIDFILILTNTYRDGLGNLLVRKN